MINALVVLTIFGSVASLLGIAYLFFGRVTGRYKILCAVGFALAAIWSGYVLLVPGSTTKSNVASKIAYYSFPSIEKKSETLLIQRGVFTLFGYGPISIEFPIPFLDPPEVEVINFKGYDPGEVPRVDRATPHQVYIGLQHMIELGFPPAIENREFRWVARGFPLEERSLEK